MRTYLDCYSCFLRHGLEAARIAGLNEENQKKVLNEIMEVLQKMPVDAKPPQLAQIIHRRIRELSGNPDPYWSIKEQQNLFMLSLEKDLCREVYASDEPLLEAVKLAGACNSIDMGPVRKWRSREELLRQIYNPGLDRLELDELKDSLRVAKKLLYVTDNAGEIVCDKVLLGLLMEHYGLECTVAVRSGPILNDATVEDTEKVGMNKVAKIITTGCDAPGAVLPACTQDFLDNFESSDLVIAKGQGNYEALEGCEKEELFFLLQVKCGVVARDLGVEEGKITLRENRPHG